MSSPQRIWHSYVLPYSTRPCILHRERGVEGRGRESERRGRGAEGRGGATNFAQRKFVAQHFTPHPIKIGVMKVVYHDNEGSWSSTEFILLISSPKFI